VETGCGTHLRRIFDLSHQNGRRCPLAIDSLCLREVQKLLGHSSAATTEVYTRVFDEDLQSKQEGLELLVL